MDPETERFFDEVADLAVDGFTSAETLSIATILRSELGARANLNDCSPFQLLMAALKLEAVAAAQIMMTTDPVRDAPQIAALQARISAYASMEATIVRVRDAGEAIWGMMEEADRRAMARIMGLEYGDDSNAAAQGYDT